MLPFCVTDVPLSAVLHPGATQGTRVPVWDSQDEFGDTNLLVSTRAQGASLARALSGGDWTILMRQHGVTVAGRSVREVVFRSIYGAHDAEVLAKAMSLGVARPLSPSEHEAAGAFNLSPIAIDRAWEQWCRRAGASSRR
jgi:ribulose-5-phosphate 4-epimerase/fuculose-1-phosphate aldolase